MTRLPLKTIAFMAILAMPFPAVSQEAAPSRTAWKSANLQSQEVVEWVFEGCAAYPVTKNAVPEHSSAGPAPSTPPVEGQPVQKIGILDHVPDQAKAQ